jgi:hypothetical protein
MRRGKDERKDKSREEWEFEKSKEELTFAPKLLSNPKYLKQRKPSGSAQPASHQ